ncbi:hypothetical protein BDY19DRAFT_38682 [Irpex rosettiformis]|uniref:Uncharacterized protein n=1 Tax=Irpex rosettiformis TaxID=378272 RepID=A0ACB8UK00_9APHY|nr:hypothetical protein BDY19DRAFT_38682 [Irpex rosettiformis]
MLARRYLWSSCLVWLGQVAFVFHFTLAQTIVSRTQVLTRGFAVFDSPAANSEMHAGSSYTLAVDVSSDGKLSQPPSSNIGIDSLNISLVSSQTSINLTVVTSPAFLSQEPGSTVKHFNSPIPKCVPPGNYNLTMYELSHIGTSQYFAITAVPINVQNSEQQGQCTGLNELLDQPQPDYPPPPNPFANPSIFPSTPTATYSGMQTVLSSRLPSYYPMPSVLPTLTYTIGDSGVQWPLTVTVSAMGPIVVVPTGYDASGSITLSDVLTDTSTPTHTITEGDETIIVVVGPTVTPPPVTVVLASVQTLTVTQTEPGVSRIVTKTLTVLSTTTGVMDPPSGVPDPGFLPINAINSGPSNYVPLSWSIFVPIAFYFAW